MPESTSYHIQVRRTTDVLTPTGPLTPWRQSSSLDVRDTFSGTKNPKWREQILAYQDATTPASGTKYEYLYSRPAELDAVTRSPSGLTYYHGYSSYPMVYTPPKRSTLVDFCDVRAREKFYSSTSDRFSGPTFLGELTETVAMLRSPAKAFRRAISVRIDAAKKLRHNLRYGRRVRSLSPERRREVYRRAWSESWLEWVFGIKPLLLDIGSIMNDIKELSFAPNIQFFNAGHSEVSKFSTPRGVSSNFNGLRSTIGSEETVKTSVRYRGAIYSIADVSTDVFQYWGFKSVEDYDCAIWEIIPWSFLSDYFFSIGDVFQAKAIAKNIRYVYCVKTVRITNTQTQYESWERPTGAIISIDNVDGFSTVQRTDFTRSAVQSVPLPSVRMRNLSEISAIQALNMTALLHLRLERSRWLKDNAPFL